MSDPQDLLLTDFGLLKESETLTAEFSAGFSGTPPCFVWWERDGVGLAATWEVDFTRRHSVLRMRPTPDDVASYNLVVSNAFGVARSGSARLHIVALPSQFQVTGLHVPQWNSREDLSLVLHDLPPAELRWAALLYYDRWYPKPAWNLPLTWILAGGYAEVDMTTGGMDVVAPRYEVFLVRPSVTVGSWLTVTPDELRNQSFWRLWITRQESAFRAPAWDMDFEVRQLQVGTDLSLDTPIDETENTVQWFLNDLPVAGATNSVLRLGPLTLGDAGVYSVAASGPGGTTTAWRAQLRGTPTVWIRNSNEFPPIEGQLGILEAVATGLEPLSVRWLRDGNHLTGATNRVIAIANWSAEDDGWYAADVIDGNGTVVRSAALNIRMVRTPRLVIHEVVPIARGGIGNLSVAGFSVPGPRVLAWRHNGVELAGQFGSSIVIQGAAEAEGRYELMSSNLAGEGVVAAFDVVVLGGIGLRIAPQPGSGTLSIIALVAGAPWQPGVVGRLQTSRDLADWTDIAPVTLRQGVNHLSDIRPEETMTPTTPTFYRVLLDEKRFGAGHPDERIPAAYRLAAVSGYDDEHPNRQLPRACGS